MTHTLERPGDPGGHRAAEPTAGDRVRFVLRGIGQTLITLGLVVLLFVVYEVWITNLFAEQKQKQVATAFQNEIVSGKDPLADAELPLPDGKQSTIPIGTGIANIYLPRLGKDYHFTIVEGVSEANLEQGPGHYPFSALPGQVGNFAMAGHRVGKGEPFLNLDQLHAGDAVVIETVKTWYVYRIGGDATDNDLSAKDANGVPGREIVDPSDTAVVDPIPDAPNATPNQRYITMTTCTPKFSASQRMILHGTLARVVPRQGDALPKELAGGTI